MSAAGPALPIIDVPPGSPLAALAARELNAHLARLATPAAITRIEIAHGDDGEGFAWQAGNGTVRITADGPRGALYAAYDLLESLGFAWPAPGDGMTVVPEAPDELPARPARRAPALAGRSLILGHHAFMADARLWIEWAARNRLNTIFFHIDEHGLGLGAIPAAQWQAGRAAAVAEARKYGMMLELGGHGLPSLLPRSAFAEHPDWFPLRGGHREHRFNFNALADDALALVRANAKAWFSDNPGFDVYHLWADDLPDSGWCEDGAAKGFMPSDQLMLATNAVASALAEVEPNALLAFLSYHDTEAPPSVAPAANVALTFAPRLRCYAAGIDAPHEVNAKYPELWRANAALFPGAGRARVFEYWLDAILFKIVAPPMVDVIRRDLAFYAANGAHTVGALATGSAPFVAPSLNAWAFARLAWNPNQSAKTIREDFCGHVFQSALHMPAYFEALERAFALDLDLRPDEARLKGRGTLEETVNDPPADIGSPFNIADPHVGDTQLRQEKALDALDEAQRIFETMMRPPGEDPPEAVLREECHRYLCHARLMIQAALLDVRAAETVGAQRDVQDAVRQARFHLNRLETEMRGFVREPYVTNTRLLLWLFVGLALDRAEDALIPGDGARRKRLKNRLETARQNFDRLRTLWPADPLPVRPAAH
ncbi:hypothetical protein sos41_11180 [Alphaproteobacteria bacterium SO-S41]|nr:hypothetical protein sos41_11180 [Alphaproteobacteria bacterium SO-S41]